MEIEHLVDGHKDSFLKVTELLQREEKDPIICIEIGNSEFDDKGHRYFITEEFSLSAAQASALAKKLLDIITKRRTHSQVFKKDIL